MDRYYIGLGSNLGDREELLQQAVQKLALAKDISLMAASSLYETPPWGKTDQPPFLNAVVAVKTELEAEELLHCCQTVENELGRVRHEKWGARTVDLDLLYSPSVECRTAELTLPHPYMTRRAFVLIPLAEIAPDLCIQGRPVRDYLRQADDAAQIRRIGTLTI